MSKTDAMRAMKAARAAERTPASPGPRTAAPTARTAAPTPAPVTDEVCGHRAISGKSCIRDKGHAEVDHRYAKTPARG